MTFCLTFQKSVNALLAVRRMSLSPLFAAKRRSSMDPSILASTSESEEDQVADRKVSAPIDPAGLGIPSRRHGETRNSCFNLDMKTIKALQEKADKAMAKTSSQNNDNDGGDEISEGENLDNGSDSGDNSSEEQKNEGSSLKDCCNAVEQGSCFHHRQRSSTVCGATTRREEVSERERKYSEILISVGSTSKQDFKPVSFTFNAQELQENNRLVSESTTICNGKMNSKELQDNHVKIEREANEYSLEISLNEGQNYVFEPQKLTFQLEESILMDSDDNATEETGDELPQICINDELFITSPPPSIPVTFNNNIEKMDQNTLGSAPSLQTSSSLNIAHVNKLAGGVQSITVNLGSLNGIQLASDHVACGVRRASTGSAPC